MKRSRSADVFGDDKAFAEPSNPGGAAFEAPPVAEMDESRVVRPVKAYKNQGFLTSHGARTIRIMAEHQETLDRLEHNGVKDFVLVRPMQPRPSGLSVPAIAACRVPRTDNARLCQCATVLQLCTRPQLQADCGAAPEVRGCRCRQQQESGRPRGCDEEAGAARHDRVDGPLLRRRD